jgi:hypothetical protein
MATVAKRTFPAWHETLLGGLEECALGYDDKRAVIEVHPLDDFYFAGVVALEASKIRQLFSDEQASELLSLIAEQVDAVADRKDRVISDLIFSIISKVDLAKTASNQKMPYDQVVKAILLRLGVDKIEATAHLMTDALYRHTLGAPLALGVPHWWQTFKSKYRLGHDIAEGDEQIDAAIPRVTATESPRVKASRKAPRRAAAF